MGAEATQAIHYYEETPQIGKPPINHSHRKRRYYLSITCAGAERFATHYPKKFSEGSLKTNARENSRYNNSRTIEKEFSIYV